MRAGDQDLVTRAPGGERLGEIQPLRAAAQRRRRGAMRRLSSADHLDAAMRDQTACEVERIGLPVAVSPRQEDKTRLGLGPHRLRNRPDRQPPPFGHDQCADG